ncbi:hypothetical protein [Rosistilla oblonga]|uniref:hypothetical protein n=1 Tax=Rosistilla oblonga TaxID=2527990 RepID=UPI003A9812A8
MISFALWSFLMLFFGYLVGVYRRDEELLQMNYAQQQRGDYWYDRYMMEAHEDWEPMTKDF